MFNNLFPLLGENLFKKGNCDRDAGRLPRMQDPLYLHGYLAGRPRGLDNEIQYFPTLETYLEWKQHFH